MENKIMDSFLKKGCWVIAIAWGLLMTFCMVLPVFKIGIVDIKIIPYALYGLVLSAITTAGFYLLSIIFIGGTSVVRWIKGKLI